MKNILPIWLIQPISVTVAETVVGLHGCEGNQRMCSYLKMSGSEVVLVDELVTWVAAAAEKVHHEQ